MQEIVRQVVTGIAIMMPIVGAALLSHDALIDAQTPAAAHTQTASTRPWVIAHRGASAYAPENTLPAFQLAVEQGATFVEYDLQPTKDGILVALHDETLERTTNVEDVFPDRFREGPIPAPATAPAAGGAPAAPPASSSTTTPTQTSAATPPATAPPGTAPPGTPTTPSAKTRRWYLQDFTFKELQQLDAGSWFDPKFAGTKIPSHAEIIEAMRGRCGLFIELKAPEKYEARGFDVEGTVLADLKKYGLDQPGADPKAPVLIQSFTASSIQKLSLTLKTRLPLHFLFGRRDRAQWATVEGLKKIRGFATGISPEKEILTELPTVAEWARDAGLAVTPYTFRAGAVKGYQNVTQEMSFYLKAFALNGVITDNPDQAPK